MNPLLALSPAIAFVVSLLLTSRWIKVAHAAGIVGIDMNKPHKPKVAEMGGIAVVAGFLSGVLWYVGLNTFIFGTSSRNLPIFAALTTVLMAALIGLVDDTLGWKAGLKQWQKPLLTLPAALPMMVVNVGVSTMALPLIGRLDLGILYPLLIVPIGIVGASNAFNMIAGFNGLEAGMGIIILFSMGTAAYLLGKPWVGVLALLMTASLLAFLIYNKYPAKVFPGDTLTYSVGAFIACIAILGNMERLAVLLYTLYYLDFALSLRGRFKVEAFGVPDEKGCLKEPRQKLYHLTHLAIRLIRLIKGCAREYEVVVLIWAMQVLISILALQHYLLY
ncbi:MAG: glycosyl transferase family 4 [Candidatus Verstraetearchaeota archaeon]|nr:glycosyl transferase family 4 [Candidatus Verstraetearchaeota archaeon]